MTSINIEVGSNFLYCVKGARYAVAGADTLGSARRVCGLFGLLPPSSPRARPEPPAMS